MVHGGSNDEVASLGSPHGEPAPPEFHSDTKSANWLVVAVALAAVGATLTGCGASTDAALQQAVSRPDSIQALKYIELRQSDLPKGYTSSSPGNGTTSQDAAQTLAEYKCEHREPPDGHPLLSIRTPDFTDPTGRTELHEATAVFPSPPAAAAILALELNRRYPSCKAAAFRRDLVLSAPKGEHVGSVSVHVESLPARFGDAGVEVEGLSTLSLAEGVSTVATSDLVVLIRGRLVAELSIDTDGPAPSALLDKLTSELADRLAQVVPHATV